MNLLRLFSFFCLMSATQAAQLSRRNAVPSAPSSMVNCSPKGNKLDYSAQVMFCRLEKVPSTDVVVTPTSSSLVFSKCTMTFTSMITEVEIIITPKPGPCATDGTNEHTIQYSYNSNDIAYSGKNDKQTVSTACVKSQVCTVSGDPHFNPFSGANFDFMGEGEYIIMDSPHGLRVTGSYYLCERSGRSNTPVTCMSGISIQYGESALMWNLRSIEGKTLKSNESMESVKQLDGYNGKGMTFITAGRKLEVKIDDGSIISVLANVFYMDTIIFLASRHYKKTCGQCNRWDNEMIDQNKYMSSTGDYVNDLGSFGESWKCKENENPFLDKKPNLKANFVADLKCVPEVDVPKDTYNPCRYANGQCDSHLTSTTNTAVKTLSTLTTAAPTIATSLTTTNSIISYATTYFSTTNDASTSATVTSDAAAHVITTTIDKVETSKESSTLFTSSATITKTSDEVAGPLITPTATYISTNNIQTSGEATTHNASTTSSTTTAAEATNLAASPTTIDEVVVNNECPSHFEDKASQICTQLIKNVIGCERVCQQFARVKIENCVKDALNFCSFDFVESHKLHYSTVCKTKTDFMINSSNVTAKIVAQEIRQNNSFDEFAGALDCGANGQTTDAGCSCQKGYSGIKCDIQFEQVLVSVGVDKIYEHDRSLNKKNESVHSSIAMSPGKQNTSRSLQRFVDGGQGKFMSLGSKIQVSLMAALLSLVYLI